MHTCTTIIEEVLVCADFPLEVMMRRAHWSFPAQVKFKFLSQNRDYQKLLSEKFTIFLMLFFFHFINTERVMESVLIFSVSSRLWIGSSSCGWHWSQCNLSRKVNVYSQSLKPESKIRQFNLTFFSSWTITFQNDIDLFSPVAFGYIIKSKLTLFLKTKIVNTLFHHVSLSKAGCPHG